MRRAMCLFAALLAFLISVCVFDYVISKTRAAAPPQQAKHGLTGSYYVGGGWDKDTQPALGISAQIWSDPNDFKLPKTFTWTSIAPAATRVDAQVAFGQGKGFQAAGGGPAKPWWPTQSAAAAVFWKGYIHLPKAGTYYFGTISHGPSAVYLNQARVALNGIFGEVLVTDAFSYAQEEVQDYVKNRAGGNTNVLTGSNAQAQYVVPVSIDSPRDLPIEVQYNWAAAGGHDYEGIDLFWVTPDSPRDANGKPIAKIVPGDMLYTEAPAGIEKPLVRSANSTISADHLYFPTEYVEGAVTVTVRLADKDGNPVAGKRVYVSGLTSYGNSDTIEQPEKPTDANGVTTAKIRAGGRGYAHDSAIFATDTTDFVGVAQVAHVTFQQVPSTFFADAFSPYYDPRFSISPRPPVVGQPATIGASLKNQSKFPAKVTVTFLTTDSNIGFTNYVEIARVKDITFQPGESKQVNTTFTPKEAIGHKCYRVEVEGEYIALNASGGKVFAAALMPQAIVDIAVAVPSPQKQHIMDSAQINTSTVAPEPVKPPFVLNPLGPPCKGVPVVRNSRTVDLDTGEPCTPSQSWKDTAKRMYGQYNKEWVEHCARAASDSQFGGNLDPTVEQKCTRLYIESQGAYRLWQDPADPAYRRLAAPTSDSTSGYLDAWTRSWERYKGAQSEGDQEWMGRHSTAIQLYIRRLAESLRRNADGMQSAAEKLLPDDASTAARLQNEQQRLNEWLGKGAPLTQEQLKRFQAAGASEDQVRAITSALKEQKNDIVLKSDRTLALETADIYRHTAEELDQLNAGPTSPELAGYPGQPLTQTYAVGNPHDKQESVDLFIRPISIPPDWKLSIVNAEQAETPAEKGPGGNSPQYPLREVEAGKHYAVTLPAKAETKITSVLIPVGEVGAHTTARWAVEGKIGNELIGGMVHERNVPYLIPDLKLPSVGSIETEEGPAVRGRVSRLLGVAAIAGALIVAMFLFLMFWRRRRNTATS